MPKLSEPSRAFVKSMQAVKIQMNTTGGLSPELVGRINVEVDNLIRSIGINQVELSRTLSELMEVNFTYRSGLSSKQIPIADIISGKIPPEILSHFDLKLTPVERHIFESIASSLRIAFFRSNMQLVPMQSHSGAAVSAANFASPYPAGPDYSGDPNARLQHKMTAQEMLERARDAALERERSRVDLINNDMKLNQIGAQTEAQQSLQRQQIEQHFVESVVADGVAMGDIRVRKEIDSVGLLKAHADTVNSQHLLMEGQQNLLATAQQQREALFASMNKPSAIAARSAPPAMQPQILPPTSNIGMFAPVNPGAQPMLATQPQQAFSTAAAAANSAQVTYPSLLSQPKR